MLNPVVLKPAYGKKYATKEQAICGWKAGDDFLIYIGPGAGRYGSIRDIKDLSYMSSTITITQSDGLFVTVWRYGQ